MTYTNQDDNTYLSFQQIGIPLLEIIQDNSTLQIKERHKDMDYKQIELSQIDLDLITNSRVQIDVEDLCESMQLTGLNNPVGVCLKLDGRYGLVYGFRRFTAATRLGWETIDCRVVSGLTTPDLLIMNLQENVSRKNLNPMEEALAIQRIQKLGKDIEKFRRELGWSKTLVSQRMSLLEMSETLIEALKFDEISVNQARAIHQAPSDIHDELIELAKLGATAKSLREKVDEMLLEFDDDEVELIDDDDEIQRLFPDDDEVDNEILANSISNMFTELGSLFKTETSYYKFKIALKSVDFSSLSNQDLNALNSALERLTGPDGLNLWGGYKNVSR